MPHKLNLCLTILSDITLICQSRWLFWGYHTIQRKVIGYFHFCYLPSEVICSFSSMVTSDENAKTMNLFLVQFEVTQSTAISTRAFIDYQPRFSISLFNPHQHSCHHVAHWCSKRCCRCTAPWLYPDLLCCLAGVCMFWWRYGYLLDAQVSSHIPKKCWLIWPLWVILTIGGAYKLE